MNLDELPLSVHRNLQCRNWLSLCKDLQPPLAALIREFYSNLHIRSDDDLGTWIWGQSFVITKDDVSEALDVPCVCRPTYPYSERPPISDVMTLLCGRSMTWGSDPRINSSELTKLNYIFFRIACHNIFPINASICFPSLFIQTLAEVHKSKCKKNGLFFPVFIYRVLYFYTWKTFLP